MHTIYKYAHKWPPRRKCSKADCHQPIYIYIYISLPVLERQAPARHGGEVRDLTTLIHMVIILLLLLIIIIMIGGEVRDLRVQELPEPLLRERRGHLHARVLAWIYIHIYIYIYIYIHIRIYTCVHIYIYIYILCRFCSHTLGLYPAPQKHIKLYFSIMYLFSNNVLVFK